MYSLNHDDSLRFWGFVKKLKTGCWVWTSVLFNSGYGCFSLDGKKVRAHRVAYQLANPSTNMNGLVLHSCNNTACCNPSHLSLGTHKENMEHMVASNRQFHPVGELCGTAKLTTEQIMSMKADFTNGLNKTQLGLKYGVSRQQASRIINGKRWSHL